MSDDHEKKRNPATPSNDVVLLHSPTADGEGIQALRARDERLEIAEIRPLKEGQPITSGEVVCLRPRKEAPFICDVEKVFQAEPSAAAPRNGPARVSSSDFRRGWEVVFKQSATRRRRAPKKQDLN